MSTPIAIMIAAAVLAVAILVTFRWELTVRPTGAIFMLDRWTGSVAYCVAPDTGGFTPTEKGIPLHCRP